MKKTLPLVVIIATLMSCGVKNARKDINGIWIPENINWKEGSFESIYIYNDTSLVKIASTNMLLKNDSIQFMTEPGFILSSGTAKVIDKNKVKLVYRIQYKAIKVFGEKLPSQPITETSRIITRGNNLMLEYHNGDYTRTTRFSSESRYQLSNMVNKFLILLGKK